MARQTKLPAIPDIDPEIDDQARRVLEPMKEIIETREGRRSSNPQDRAVTWGDLIRLGLATEADIP